MTDERLLDLADAVACSLQSLVDAKHEEDVDWPGVRRDLERYWAARLKSDTNGGVA